jgi:hypothetical protein
MPASVDENASPSAEFLAFAKGYPKVQEVPEDT